MMNKNNLVKDGYNKIAKNYSSSRDQFKNNHYLEKLVELLKPEATILDIGCGSGIPIDKYLVDRGFKVLGIDISEKQIELAKQNVPQAIYKVKGMEDLKDGEYQVDAVVSFYAIFHIPKEQHQDLVKKISSFLTKNGLILVTMGSGEWEGIEDDFHGGKMYWSHYGPEKNRKIVESCGFKMLLDEIDTSGGEKHQVILAQKISAN